MQSSSVKADAMNNWPINDHFGDRFECNWVQIGKKSATSGKVREIEVWPKASRGMGIQGPERRGHSPVI